MSSTVGFQHSAIHIPVPVIVRVCMQMDVPNRFGVCFADVGTAEINLSSFDDDAALTQYGPVSGGASTLCMTWHQSVVGVVPC